MADFICSFCGSNLSYGNQHEINCPMNLNNLNKKSFSSDLTNSKKFVEFTDDKYKKAWCKLRNGIEISNPNVFSIMKVIEEELGIK